jgi:hypothetical protein
MMPRFKKLLLAATSSLLAILLAEVVVRIVLPAPGFYPARTPIGLLMPHPTRGYAYSPGFSGVIETSEYTINVDINEMGLRDDTVNAGEHIDILAAGDSFTVGFGVEAGEAWPARLQSYLRSTNSGKNFRVLNAGVSGYSVRQIRLLVEELTYLRPDTVVLGVYASRYWRIENPYLFFKDTAVLEEELPRLLAVPGGFVQSPFHGPGLKRLYFWLAENFHLGGHVLGLAYALYKQLGARDGDASLSADAAQRVETLLTPLFDELRRMRQILSDHGIELIVLMVNHQEADGSFAEREALYNRIVSRFCDVNGIRSFDPLTKLAAAAKDDPVFRIGADHHWSTAAHELVGRELAEFLRRGSVPQLAASRISSP